MGMWRKGKEISGFRGVEQPKSFYELEKETGRNHSDLKKWNDLYEKYPCREDYQKSVKRVSGLIYKWKNVTEELANELHIAREILSKEGRPWPSVTGANAPVKTWNQYCEDIGCNKSTVNRWLNRFFPQELPAATPLPAGAP